MQVAQNVPTTVSGPFFLQINVFCFTSCDKKSTNAFQFNALKLGALFFFKVFALNF